MSIHHFEGSQQRIRARSKKYFLKGNQHVVKACTLQCLVIGCGLAKLPQQRSGGA
jgi:hypothetical protein